MKTIALAALCFSLVACGGAFVGSAEDAPDSGPYHEAATLEAGADTGSDVITVSPEATPGEDASREASSEAAPEKDSGPEASAPEASPEASPEKDAGSEAGPTCPCTNTLSDVGLGDFSIGFDVMSTSHPVAPGYEAILAQRSECDANKPGWVVWMNPSGTVNIQVYSGGNDFTDIQTAVSVNDGAKHHVLITRTANGVHFNLVVDSTQDPNTSFAEALNGPLAPLQTGTDNVCVSNAAQPAEPFVGTISNVCICAQ